MNDKAERTRKANDLILTIANYGRKFFQHNGRISRFELDARGRIWFIDAYRESRIYTHYAHGHWRGFSEGGTLRDLVIALRKHIKSIDRTKVAKDSAQSPNSSGFKNNLSALRSLGVLEYDGPQSVKALPVLFLE
jgi:predicted RNA-binding Zn ribbon-like protein